MSREMIKKLEKEARVLELNPVETLGKVDFKDPLVLCDLGAGTGVFAFEAAKISSGDIFALEISDEMLELLESRKVKYESKNVIVKKVENNLLPLEDGSCDLVLMVTVFHELDEKEVILEEVRRVLGEKGKMLIIEFHKRPTPMGPPLNHRIGEEEVEAICKAKEFEKLESFSLGENFYGILFG